ncbi:hypothetical protein CEP54_014498 [Fusarium duplospermum]|uniref:Uncharacterized protein n=1 Tax=Fusarium duplospermum TaxID=1325734 RepID=A0A428NVV1_9HYPO|nr:hypothetical protein CEP54_014498 [Fusarium duplospermum]
MKPPDRSSPPHPSPAAHRKRKGPSGIILPEPKRSRSEDIRPPDGAAAAVRQAYESEQEALQCDHIYDTLAKAYRDYAACGIQREAPPKHEVYSLGDQHEGDDIHVPGHIQNTPFPRYYSSWGFRYESSCEASISGGEGRMRPCELNSPVLGECLGESYGAHINVSFGSCPGETYGDIVRTLKRLLTITLIVEEHIFGVLCPDREPHCGPYLSSARDCSLGGLVDRVCKAPRNGHVGRRAVRIHLVEDDTPKQLIVRTAHSDVHHTGENEEEGEAEDDDCEEAGDDDDVPPPQVQADITAERMSDGGEDAAGDGRASSETDTPEDSIVVIEFRYAPASFARQFLLPITSVCLSMARLSHHGQPSVRFRALLGDLYQLTSAGSPSVATAAALIKTLQSYIEPMYQHTLSFDEAYFEKRMRMYEGGDDPNLDEDQTWAAID